MSQQEISCGLEYAAAPVLQECLTEALRGPYAFIVSPVIHPRFRRHHVLASSGFAGFTRSDMLLSPQDWTVRIVGKLSPYLDVDAPSMITRRKHEDCMMEELLYCRGLGLPAVMLTLHGSDSTNLSRILHSYYETSHHPSLIWARVPMVCYRTYQKCINQDSLEESDEPWEKTWKWWSKFHERMDWDKRVGVVLEISADLPSKAIQMRWLGEPVRAVIVPTSVFHTNKKGYPVLSRMHQQLLISFVERDAQVIVSGARHCNFQYYAQFMYRMWQRRPHQTGDPMLNYARGWEDYLQTPLQPLADNLDTHTYNVFEKDPIKYDQYQKAIAQALLHLKMKDLSLNNIKNSETVEISQEAIVNGTDEIVKGDSSKSVPNKVYTVMVLGAGRGPLIRATLNAAELTHSRVKIIAVEKNPCAVVVLTAQVREVWYDRDVTVMAGDMRHIELTPKADIIVSELLGSWGDNELSPECLDGAAGLLKPEGISIPCAYTSYVAPISSPRLWAAAKAVVGNTGGQQETKNLETLWVVYMQNKHDIGETKPVFTFEHPAKGVKDNEGIEIKDFRGLPAPDNRRSAILTWEVEQDNVMHGFGGYFDCRLFGSENLSIVPSTHSPGMISWFPVFIPIKTPMRVLKGDRITATFWRCVNSRRVWYEWIVQIGNHTTSLHNCNGRSSEMLL